MPRRCGSTTRVPGRRDRGEGVRDVVRAALPPFDLGDDPAAGGARGTFAPVGRHLESADQSPPSPARSTGVQHPIARTSSIRGSPGPGHDAPAARHDPHDVMELALHVAEIVEDVGVVELEVVQDQDVRAVVHELRALVEKRGVVLVGLDDEPPPRAAVARRVAPVSKSSGAPATRNPGSRPAVSRITASIAVVLVLPWVPATAMTCRPVSTCSESHAGPEVNRSLVVEDVLYARVAAGHRVADHHEVRRRRSSWAASYPVHHRNAGPLSSTSLIGGYTFSSDPVTRWPSLAGDQGEPAHERAADAEESGGAWTTGLPAESGTGWCRTLIEIQ